MGEGAARGAPAAPEGACGPPGHGGKGNNCVPRGRAR